MNVRTWTHGARSGLFGPRRTIGVVIDNLVDGYQRILFDSITRTAREQDVNVVAFVGGPLPSPHYDLIGTNRVDALILSGATLAHKVGASGLAEFCRRFNGLPICSIGISVEGLSSIVTNDGPGATALVTHLLAEHQKRKIACIRGPGADGATRYAAFARTLEEFGVPMREELVVDGDFTQPSGAEAVRILCDERKVEFDAIVCGNDYMALGVITALEERDLAIPRDIAVVGFDDIEDARYAVVPLTTVRQPIRELGKRAVQAVLRQLNHQEAGEVQSITCHPLKRRSCGCVVESPFTRRPASCSQTFDNPVAALAARRALVLADLSRTAQGELGSVGYDWEHKLFGAIEEELTGPNRDCFLAANEELSRRVLRAGGDVSTWQRVLGTLRQHVLECVGDNVQLRSAAESGFYDALLLSANVIGREEALRRDALSKLLRTAVHTGTTLLSAVDSGQVSQTLVRHLRSLPLASCYLAWFTDQQHQQARLVVGFDQELPATEVDQPIAFPARDLTPDNLLPRARNWVYVCMPLTFEGTALGFALFEHHEHDAVLFDILRDQLSTALYAGSTRS